MTEQRPKACVILGAGASHDVWNPGSPPADESYRPPLAIDLFNIGGHPELPELSGDIAVPMTSRISSRRGPTSKRVSAGSPSIRTLLHEGSSRRFQHTSVTLST